MPKYKALEKGYDGNRVIKAGEVFEAPMSYGTWMELVEKPESKEDIPSVVGPVLNPPTPQTGDAPAVTAPADTAAVPASVKPEKPPKPEKPAKPRAAKPTKEKPVAEPKPTGLSGQ